MSFFVYDIHKTRMEKVYGEREAKGKHTDLGIFSIWVMYFIISQGVFCGITRVIPNLYGWAVTLKPYAHAHSRE